MARRFHEHGREGREVIGRWHDRSAAGDVEGVLELIAEDAVFLTPGHPPIEGRARFETGLRKVLATYRIESTGNIREVVVVGDVAYCVTALSVRMTPREGGEANVRSGYAMSVFRKRPDGTWRLSRDANLLSS